MPLILVESPTKAKTLKKFLGSKYNVLATMGHIRDLPKGELGIDVENNFAPRYVIPVKARKTVNELKKNAKETDVILGVDEDREGEAIAWHLSEILKLENPKRIVFHEITKQAIENALKSPRAIDLNLVNAQQARRILDRLVGYNLSPFLWKKISRGLSAGRVQSVAVRLIVERENQIKSFKPQEYWTIEALLGKTSHIAGHPEPMQEPEGLQKEKQNAQTLKHNEFTALLVKKDDKPITKSSIETKKQADEIIEGLKGAEYIVKSIEKKQVNRNPLPPYITSALQQDAWKKFRFSAKQTMRLAQQLYEHGLTTYHRTDSLNLSSQAIEGAKKFIEKNLGKEYSSPKSFKSKKGAQEAHEAIRPAYPEKTPGNLKLDGQQKKLYGLIWQRFIASQMSKAIFNSVAAEIKAKNYLFRATGQTLFFDGFLKIYPIKFEEKELPLLSEKELLDLKKIIPSQHFTQPPPRYTEAGLIKALEEKGIGRPSTYAPTISTIQERNYVQKNSEKRFEPTEMGIMVDDILLNHFPKIVDVNFTAQMEESLDQIAEGKKQWINVCKDFYVPFEKNLKEKYEQVEKKEITERTGKKCPKCNSDIIIKFGKFGKFLACSNFPECKHTESLEKKDIGVECPKCLFQGKKSQIIEKKTKKGKIFYGCSDWPKCDFALWDKPTKEKCKKCGFLMVEKNKKELKCSNKECDFKVDPAIQP